MILACVMVFTFVGLLPLGTLILRVLGWTRIHGINQILASVLGLVGAGLGIYIITAMLVQLVLGVLHHREYKQTQQTTKIAPIHVWLGRIVILCGVANGFL